jgi:glycosyl transferase, family 25
MKTFVINLKSSLDRRQFMARQLDTLPVEYEFIEAVDGRKLTNEQIEASCDMNQVRAWPELLTPAMIGCSLSHYKVYLEIVNRKIPYAVVLEDDTYLTPQFLPIVARIQKALVGEEINRQIPVLLYYQSKQSVPFSSKAAYTLGDDVALYYPIDIWKPITTAAYIVTQEVAQKLVQLVFPIKFSPDSWAVFHREQAIDGLCCVLPLPVRSGFFKSDIGYELNKPLNRFVKLLEEKSIFPVPQILKHRRQKRAIKLNSYVLVDDKINWKFNTVTGRA